MQPITPDFTDIILTVVTSGNGMVALAILIMMFGYIIDIVYKNGLHAFLDDNLDKAYDSYVSYHDKKKYSSETLEIYESLGESQGRTIHGYEDRLKTYRERKSSGLLGISSVSSFSFSDIGWSGGHRKHYSVSTFEAINERVENEKNSLYVTNPLDNEDSNNLPYSNDLGMDVYLTWDEIDTLSPIDTEVSIDDSFGFVNNSDFIPFSDNITLDLGYDFDLEIQDFSLIGD